MDLQTAQRLQEFIQRMEGIAERSPAEEQALQRAIAAMPQETIDEFGARYRGLAQGVTLGGGDELRAAGAGIVPGGQTYDQALEDQRMRNLSAEMLNPEAYASGKSAGQMLTGAATMAIPGGVASTPLRAVLGGGLAGGAITAAPSFLEGEGGMTARLSQVPPVQTAVGAGLGALAGVAGPAAGSVTRAAQNLTRSIPGFGPRASQVAARGVGRTAATGEDIPAYLRSLGDEAMLADVVGGPQSQAMGLAAQQGRGGTAISQALTNRARGSEGRIADVVTDVAGDPNAAFRQRAALAQERTGTLGPAYEAAISHQGTLNAADAVKTIDDMLDNAVGATAARLNVYRRLLSENDGEISAARLHNIRSQVSDTISAAARQGRGGVVASLSPLLQKIDDQLDQVPNYAATRTGYANVREMERQVEAGREVLSPGRSTTSPDALSENFSKLSDAQKDAFRNGAREYIAALMGTARNAPAAAWSELSTGFNDQKLRILFGNDEAERIMRTLRAERAFSETRGRVLGGSMTAQRRIADEELGPVRSPDTGRMPGPVARARNTMNDAINSAVDKVLYGTRRSDANLELGRILSLTGPERDLVVQALLDEAQNMTNNTRAQAVTQILTQMGFGAGIAAMNNED